MAKVKVKVFGAGSLEVEGPLVKTVYDLIIGCLKAYDSDTLPCKVTEIRRGPKKKVVAK